MSERSEYLPPHKVTILLSAEEAVSLRFMVPWLEDHRALESDERKKDIDRLLAITRRLLEADRD